MNRPRGRPFEPGNTAGRGRPKGSRNKTKSPEQQLLDQYAESIMRKCIAMALQGDHSAQKLCMERISPARRDASVRTSLPKVEKAQDVGRAADKVLQDIQRGKMTPAEGETMMRILEIRSRIIERCDTEKLVQDLEQEAAAQGGYKP